MYGGRQHGKDNDNGSSIDSAQDWDYQTGKLQEQKISDS